MAALTVRVTEQQAGRRLGRPDGWHAGEPGLGFVPLAER